MEEKFEELTKRVERIEKQMKVILQNGETKEVSLGVAIAEIWHYTAGLRFFYRVTQFLDSYPGLKKPVRVVVYLMVTSFIYSIFSVPVKDLMKWIF